MTKFEQMLVDEGYIKYIINWKENKYEKTEKHIISTMVNIDHRYFHKDDPAVKRIESGNYILGEDFTWDDRKGEICFGLHEAYKPPTLIYPRPKIEIKRIKDGKEVVESQIWDDSMNVVLNNFSPEEILEAMYNNDIVLKVDLTANN